MRLRLLWITATAITVLGLAAVACDGSPVDTTAPRAEITRVMPSPTAERGGSLPTTVPAPTPTAVRTAIPVPAPTAIPIAVPAPVLTDNVDGYMALAPATLRSGQQESISISLFSGGEPARGRVNLALMRRGGFLAESSGYIDGSGTVSIQVPDIAPGDYSLRIDGDGFEDTANVRVEDGTVLFLETDKPVYKPGQEILVRVLRLGPELKPLAGNVTVEIQDAKGLKVYREETTTDAFGMATLKMPLSNEPNLGTWKVTSRSGEQTTQVDVRVEEYVLPKYEISLRLPKNWVLAGETLTGDISAEYSFGKPVRGEVEIVASRYVGAWEEFATFTSDIDGTTSFELPPVGYVSGVPGAGGQGNITLEVTVTEKSTGYVERTTRLLTVANAPVNLQIIPESPAFKPSLPFSLMLVTETPDNRPVSRRVTVNLTYLDGDLKPIEQKSVAARTERGKAMLRVTPPREAVALTIEAQSGRANAYLNLEASYSPSGNFIHVELLGDAVLNVGDQARFRVSSTREAGNFYYEVISRGKVVFSDSSRSPDIALGLTPIMGPSSRLVVYQILPNNEVAADYIPFNVAAVYPLDTSVAFGADEVRPGETVDVNVSTSGPAKVGLSAVDRSVYILAENRQNLQQVFAELDRLYMRPQVELHEARSFSRKVTTRGAGETFQDAGLVVISNLKVPAGKNYSRKGERQEPGVFDFLRGIFRREKGADGVEVMEEQASAEAAIVASSPTTQPQQQLAEVSRVRQFFPETWLWSDVMTDEEGRASVPVEAPDSITTWVLRGVALSQEHGLGIAEAELRVFQPFFLQVDLPYAAVRGEEFPVKVALYNYLDTPQEFFVELEEREDFELLDVASKSVTVAPSDIGGLEFKIRLTDLGQVPIKVTARSAEAADAVVKDLLVEPEGVSHETVENMILSPGETRTVNNAAPIRSIPGSARTRVTLTGSYLSQTLEGLEGLLRMPFGCGEQNMILFAPNVFVAEYLEKTGQLKPEVMAKAERLMITGYQRELTYRRGDGSFSAFGDSDSEGSLWLTAFVLKTFNQAQGLIYMDDQVLQDAAGWILKHQRDDGSFKPVGFLHHQELLGGLRGNTALTAYVAIALQEAGEVGRAAKAREFLAGQLDAIDDPYTMAMAAYALALGQSSQAGDAYDKLMSMAIQDGNGMHWGDVPAARNKRQSSRKGQPSLPGKSAAVETTGYAMLALLERGDRASASSAARWLVSQRNAFGGFGSTQDTVVGLQALIEFATHARFDVDMTVNLKSGDWSQQVKINEANADLVRVLDVPIGDDLLISTEGSGEVVAQVVRRFNRPEVDLQPVSMFDIEVTYSADQIEVNDRITVTSVVRFTPPIPAEAGMVVLDVSVPTGFAPVVEGIKELVSGNAKIKRFDLAGRKVILYIQDLAPEESLRIQFDAVALYPVRAQPVTSQVYSYYNPQWRVEVLGESVTVNSN